MTTARLRLGYDRGVKAVRLVAAGSPLVAQEVPRPEPGPGELLVRVGAAGICHSDAHYRSGRSRAGPLPLTPGHEVAGTVDVVGPDVDGFVAGDRVCLHYLVTCGACATCRAGHEQFCPSGAMLGKDRDGGYAEFVLIPARSAFTLPDAVPFEHGAVLMCSSATSLHALRKAQMQPGDTVAIFGVGGLGVSAVQLALALGARVVYAVDIRAAKLELAERLGAVPIDASGGDPVARIREATGGRGVDVALELIGAPGTMRQAVLVLANLGRAALAGLTDGAFEIAPYAELINREASVVGVSDHLASELPELLDLAATGRLDLTTVVSETVALDAAAINDRLDQLEAFTAKVRFVITP